MKTNDKNPYILNRILLGLNNFMGISIGFLIVFVSMRLLEFIVLSSENTISSSLAIIELKAIRFDIAFYFQMLAMGFLPIMLLYLLINMRVVNFLLYVFGSAFILFDAVLILYFSTTKIPLGAELFGYSKEEINQTIGASGALSVLNILLAAVLIFVTIFLVRKCKVVNYPIWIFILMAFISTFTYFFPQISNAKEIAYKSEFEYYTSVNKIAYFKIQAKTYFNKESDQVFDGYYYDDDYTEGSIKYVDPNFPFLHLDSTSDVLGPFFNKSKVSPNVVIIIVESLGTSYSGPFAELESFTPFLDSISKLGLYWPNFLSTGGRTFAALPSILGSLPYAQQGFLELGNKMPNHQSLMRILKANGYSTAFYHGGNSEFDFMNEFLQKQEIDVLVDQSKFSSEFSTMPKNAGGFTWGYGDLELFKQYFKYNFKTNKPRLEVFLTLSNHNPFKINGQLKYYQLFENKLNQLGMNESRKQEYRAKKDIYSCILYSDDAVRFFINEYKKRSDYSNTIFIITGDHRMPELPLQSTIDRFRVPMIVYSPLLKHAQTFQSVSSHLDMTPTLLAYLSANYSIKKPSLASWIGTGIDTNHSFRNTHIYPLMRNKNELIDFIDYSNYTVNNRTFRIVDGLKIENHDDATAQKISKAKFEDYLRRNSKAIKNNALIPDSIFYFSPFR